MPDLRKGQYKRIGRISESNPERAERVADRMYARANREEIGKSFANFKPFREEAIRKAKQKNSVQAEAKQRNSVQSEEHKPNPEQEQAKKRDTPLSTTPEPKSKWTGKVNY